ncbi:hypothetical protein F4780DRAFT_375804 [Xylariomycetidae sp. FL0641]|nr:hypothetical protein F4780DRAFT_375804 [Xylariomycetidae sp. FL0641]
MPRPLMLKGFIKKLLPKKSNSLSVTPSTPANASETALDDVPLSTVSEKQSAPPLEDCPICHDPVGAITPEGIVESWATLHCGHKFGSHCLQTWLEESVARDQITNPSCPVCRAVAKHASCGHPISPAPFPVAAAVHLQQWQYFHEHFADHHADNSPPPVVIAAGNASYGRRRGERVRRRLTRRLGNPLRGQGPAHPQPPKRKVQTVGECKTCADNAAFDRRMKALAEQHRRRWDTGPDAALNTYLQHTAGLERGGSSSWNNRGAGLFKSVFKRSVTASVRPTVRTTVVSYGYPDNEVHRDERDIDYTTWSNLLRGDCDLENVVSPWEEARRAPTPTPAIGSARRGSI